jgi:hypothetical protein
MFTEFEVTAVTMKNAAFWDVAPCGSCKNRQSGGTCSLHLQGKKYACKKNVGLLLTLFSLAYFFYFEDGGDTFLRNVCILWHCIKIYKGKSVSINVPELRAEPNCPATLSQSSEHNWN